MRTIHTAMQNTNSKILRPSLALCVAAMLLVCAPTSHAKNGKDDPAGHNTGDNRGGKGRGTDNTPGQNTPPAPRPSGDDPADHDADVLRKASGADDPIGHDAGDVRGGGKDDPLNHDAGDDKGGADKTGGKGRGGRDDAPGHR